MEYKTSYYDNFLSLDVRKHLSIYELMKNGLEFLLDCDAMTDRNITLFSMFLTNRKILLRVDRDAFTLDEFFNDGKTTGSKTIAHWKSIIAFQHMTKEDFERFVLDKVKKADGI